MAITKQLQALIGERRVRLRLAAIAAVQGVALVVLQPCFAAELAFDSSGNLFFEGNNTGTIFKYAPNGSRTTFATSAKDTALNGGLAVAPNGDVYACANVTTILKFAPDGTKSVFATDVGKYWPSALAVDAVGNLFVSASGDTIFKFTPGGNKSTFATGVTAYGLAFDRSGNLFACDGHAENGQLVSALVKFSPDGSKSVVVPGLQGYGLVFDPSGNFFVAVPDGILKFTPDGHKSALGTDLDASGGLAIDAAGNLVACDGNNKLAKITSNGAKKAFAVGPSAAGRPNEEAEDSDEGLPEKYARDYLIAAAAVSPNKKFAVIYPKFSDAVAEADPAKIKNYIITLQPFSILGALDTKWPYFQRQSHGGLSAEWSKDGSVALVTLESKWGPGDIILLEFKGAKLNRMTNLTIKMHDLLVQDYQKAKAAPYNEYSDFVFESEDDPICKWEGSRRVRLNALATTDPKRASDERVWEGRLKTTWDIDQARFISPKVIRVFAGVRKHED